MNETPTVIVHTPSGGVRGLDGAVRRFAGIPYAQPPVGDLRWRAPRPVQPWSGVRDALRFAPDPPQRPDPALRGDGMSEDCLHLTVWTPTQASGPLPVMVWLPGGGFVSGSASHAHTDGAALAALGVVVVSVNYRLGVLGFLAHPGLAAETDGGHCGNYGLQDQIEALRWVRSHIASFGGDASRVTVFGVSAGAACISLMLTSPAARGLFHQAILQSPGCGRQLATRGEAQQVGAQLLGNDLAALRALPADRVTEHNAAFAASVRSPVKPRILRPIVDGAVVTGQEREAWRAGQFQALPMIVGNHLDEGRFFARQIPLATVDDYRRYVTQGFGEQAAGIWRLYGATRDADVARASQTLFADSQFNFGVHALAKANAGRAPTWRFLFDEILDDGGLSTHSQDVPFVFGTLGLPGAPAANEPLRRASDFTMRAWARFAAGGSPMERPDQWPPSDGASLLSMRTQAQLPGWQPDVLEALGRLLEEAGRGAAQTGAP